MERIEQQAQPIKALSVLHVQGIIQLTFDSEDL